VKDGESLNHGHWVEHPPNYECYVKAKNIPCPANEWLALASVPVNFCLSARERDGYFVERNSDTLLSFKDERKRMIWQLLEATRVCVELVYSCQL